MTKRIIHTSLPDGRGTLAERLSRLETQHEDLKAKLAGLISAGVLAAGKKIYQELYEDLAKEHGRVFQVQEYGIDALMFMLQQRVARAESSPLPSLRDTIEAIAWYIGKAEEHGMTSWESMTPLDQQLVIEKRIAAAKDEIRTIEVPT